MTDDMTTTNIQAELEAVEPRIFKVPEANLADLEARIERLNKRARKLSVAPITIHRLSTEDIPVWRRIKDFEITSVVQEPEDAAKRLVWNSLWERTGAMKRFFHLTIEGETPKLAGWAFIATITPVADEDGKVIGNEVRAVPGNVVPTQYRDADLHCDHCQTARRRNDVFIIRHDDGTTKQIGRNCLVDFLGGADPKGIAAAAEYLMSAYALAGAAEDDDFLGEGGGRRTPDRASLDEVLNKAAAIIRTEGWRSRATAETYGTTPTSSEVKGWVFDSKWRRDQRVNLPIPEITDADKKMAAETMEWLSEINGNAENDYLYNLALLGRASIVEYRQVGLAVSAINAYLRDVEREINRRKRIDMHKASEFVGEVGKRMGPLTLTLEFTREFEGDYGVRHLYKFVDEKGNVLVWWASKGYTVASFEETLEDARTGRWTLGKGIEVGDTIQVMGTVKAHEVREEIKQTLLSRVAEYMTKEQKKALKKAREEAAKGKAPEAACAPGEQALAS